MKNMARLISGFDNNSVEMSNITCELYLATFLRGQKLARQVKLIKAEVLIRVNPTPVVEPFTLAEPNSQLWFVRLE